MTVENIKNMEKTIEEKRNAVIAYCENACPQSTKGFWYSISRSIKLMHHPSESHRWSLDFFDGDGSNEWLCVLSWIGKESNEEEISTAYIFLGLDKKDALEAEKAKSANLVAALENIQTKCPRSIASTLAGVALASYKNS